MIKLVRLNAALRIGLEWIRKLYDTDDSDAIRVSYFKIRCNTLNNIARAPLGTELTPVRFKRGEGFAGLLWQQFVYNSNSNYIRSSNLPAAKDELSELIRLLHEEGVKLDEKKVLRFKSDIRSYLIIAAAHPVNNHLIGIVSLDSKEPNTFQDDELLTETQGIVDKIVKILYVKRVVPSCA